MDEYICVTCGTQYPESAAAPEHCLICEDERQYIGPNGQKWTTLEALQREHINVIRDQEPKLTGIGTDPKFAIGQRALLVHSDSGNILWDCISLLDAATIETIHELGDIKAIAISHPHFYSSMVTWAHAFDAKIYLHAADRDHVMHPDPVIEFWEGETKTVGDGITLIRTGGHFAGSTVLHWAQGAGGRGALLTGDSVNVVQDRRFVSFLYSYPNQIPLPARSIRKIITALEPYEFERIYGGWWDSITPSSGKEAIRFSAERYIAAIEG